MIEFEKLKKNITFLVEKYSRLLKSTEKATWVISQYYETVGSLADARRLVGKE